MTDHQSDAELHMERLVQIAVSGSDAELAALSVLDRFEVLAARMEMIALRGQLMVMRLRDVGR